MENRKTCHQLVSDYIISCLQVINLNKKGIEGPRMEPRETPAKTLAHEKY